MDPEAANGFIAFGDVLMNRALAAEKAGQQDLATAHLEIALQVMLRADVMADPED